MTKRLKLFNGFGKFIDGNDYVKVANDRLVIRVETEFGNNTTLYAVIVSGEHQAQLLIKNKEFSIDYKLLKVGECNITIIAKCGSQEVARYKCVPLIIKELFNEKVVLDELVEFKEKVAKCEAQLAETNKKLDEMKKLMKLQIIV